VGRERSVGIVTLYGWMVKGSNPGRGEISLSRSDRPWGPPSLLYNGHGVYPVVKRQRCGLNQLFKSSAEVKERVEL